MTPEELLDALNEAARANRQDEFDRLERDLLNRFEDGFAGMPPAIYERYLEVDRSWPAGPGSGEPGRGSAASGRYGPRLVVNARLPEELLEWLSGLGAETGRSRSDVLAEALGVLRGDRELEARVLRALSGKAKEPGKAE